ncbi:MAG: hypothetical protein ACHREM_15630 [Polyangiales bacterium]
MRVTSIARVMIATAIVALLVHGSVVAIKARMDPSHSLLAIFRIGELAPDGSTSHPSFVTDERFPLERGGHGTDGQQYLFVAHDPLALHGEMGKAIDAPRYRYGRILLPTVAFATCAARSPCIPFAILAWNLVFATSAGAAAAWLVRKRGAHPAWALVLCCSGGLICATDIAGVEVAAACFTLWAIVAYESDRIALATVAFALAGLARESHLIVAVAFVAVALRDRRTRDAAILASSALPRIAWSAWLVARGVPVGAHGGAALNFTWPFGGLAAHLVEFARAPHVTGSTLITLVVAVPLLGMMGREAWVLVSTMARRHGDELWARKAVMISGDDVSWGAEPRSDAPQTSPRNLQELALAPPSPAHQLRSRGAGEGGRGGEVCALATTLALLLALCASSQVWVRAGGFARAFEMVYATSVLAALQRRDRVTLVLSLSTFAHALNVMAAHFIE